MIHLNEVWKQQGLASQIGELTQPQVYIASTISDFLDAMQGVKPTSFLRAYINLNPHLHGKSIINVPNVIYTRMAPDRVKLEDLSAELEVGVRSVQELERMIQQQEISNEDKIQFAIISYQRSDNRSYIYDLQKSINAPKPELAPPVLADFAPAH